MSNIINTRADLDAIAGTPEHARFLAYLAGTVNQWQWDSADQEWVLVQNERSIARFGFSLSDFPDPPTPAKPDYNPDDRDADLKRQWFMDEIEARADTELNKGIVVSKDGVDYLVATTASARSLIVGGKIAAQEAIDAGVSITEPIPTDKGIVDANEKELVALFNLVKDRRREIVERVRTLHGKVADGTITEADLEVWP